MVKSANSEIRWHAMDALRAAMMLFGIFLHGSLAYITHFHVRWPIQDTLNHPLFDSIVRIIHLFRM